MKPLSTCQRVVNWLFINPPDGSINKREKRIYVVAYAFGILCIIGSLISSVIVFQNVVSTNLEMAFYPPAQILPLFACLNIMAVDEETDSFHNFAEANNRSECAWKIFAKRAILLVSSCPLLSIFSIFVCWYMHGGFDAKHVFHATKLM